MRSVLSYSIIMLAAVVASFCLVTSASAQTYAVGEPMIIPCPESYKGEMTVVETNQKQAPWSILRWNCQGSQGLVKQSVLNQYLLKNPPEQTSSRRWEEKCPSGSVGSIIFSSHEARRFVDSWTCSLDGSKKMPFDELKRMLENNETIDGASGVTRQRPCPAPYLGNYSVVYRLNKWDLQQWTCVAPGTKNRVSEPTMRMLIPQ